MVNPFLGVFLHAIGGLAAASFYIPFKKVKNWSWESYWLINGIFSWVIVPSLVLYLLFPGFFSVLKTSIENDPLLRKALLSSIFWSYIFGILWGIGGLTFGLSMRYLGMSLGYAVALGFCAAFGTIIPPLFQHQLGGMMSKLSGQVTLSGVLVCLAGIAVCGKAGVMKEKELPAEDKKATIKEFNFVKGIWVAAFAGIMSACMAFAMVAGKPIAALAVEKGIDPLWQYSPVYVVIFAGGFTTNLIWCLALNIRNGTLGDYLSAPGASILVNYIFSALAGITWYFQFMFYGMGTTRMGRYDFSSWTIHMAFIIIFSNVWGLLFKEWKGTGRKTHRFILLGILVLISSTLVVGLGNYIASHTK